MTLTFWVFLSSLAKPNSILNNSKVSKTLTYFFIVLVCFTIPFKDFYEGDMINYIDNFRQMHTMSFPTALREFTWEPLFILLQWVISRFTTDISVYIVTIWIVYILVFYFAIRNIFDRSHYIFIIFAYLNFSFFYSYIFVGSRQGIAMVFLLLAISYWIKKEPKHYKFILACVFASLFHYSSIAVVISLVLIRLFKLKTKPLLIIWGLSAILFLFKLTEYLIMPLAKYLPSLNDYTTATIYNQYNRTGYRLDFFFFSFVVLILAFYFTRFVSDEKKESYKILINVYVVFNIYFLLFGFIAFSNRLSIYSWFLIPILFWYPVLNQKNHKVVATIVATLITCIVGIFTTIQFYN